MEKNSALYSIICWFLLSEVFSCNPTVQCNIDFQNGNFHCIQTTISNIKYKSKLLDDDKSDHPIRQGFNKAIQFDILTAIMEMNVRLPLFCHKYQSSNINCYRRRANNTIGVNMHLQSTMTDYELKNLFNNLQKKSSDSFYYKFTETIIKKGKKCDECL
ncbi:hypothetical protein T07_1581 [Trichinella nelsoni]|uniref:Uncharacterized protein n=1 Tax=Trichinella nelsoni TaxID=6336 RepID=A0A0V0SPH0_9BILA|nr:hypothetical protein T07_1581 [Trichinella nelsoni]